jgi:DNA-binding MarR family transcriptional regulator
MIKVESLDREIILAVGRAGKINITQLINRVNASGQTVYTYVAKLIGAGILAEERGGFPQTRWLSLTLAGRELYLKLEAGEATFQTLPAPLPAFHKAVKKRASNTIKYMAPFLEESFFQAYKSYITTAATLGVVIPAKKEIREKLETYAEQIAAGATLLVYPPMEASEASTRFQAHILEAVGHALSIPSFRQKVAESGKLTIVLTMDFSKLPEDDRGQILFWSLVYHGLRREGKLP